MDRRLPIILNMICIMLLLQETQPIPSKLLMVKGTTCFKPKLRVISGECGGIRKLPFLRQIVMIRVESLLLNFCRTIMPVKKTGAGSAG